MSKSYPGGGMYLGDGAPDNGSSIKTKFFDFCSACVGSASTLPSKLPTLLGVACWVISVSLFVRSLTTNVWYEFDHIEHLNGKGLEVGMSDIHIHQLTMLQPIPVLLITALLHIILIAAFFCIQQHHVNVFYRSCFMLVLLVHGITLSYFIMIPFQTANRATCTTCDTQQLLNQFSLSNADPGPSFWWLVASWCTFTIPAIPLYGTVMAFFFNNWPRTSFDMQLTNLDYKKNI